MEAKQAASSQGSRREKDAATEEARAGSKTKGGQGPAKRTPGFAGRLDRNTQILHPAKRQNCARQTDARGWETGSAQEQQTNGMHGQ